MDSAGAFWLCVATFVVGGIVGGGFHRKENNELKKSAHRYRVEREGVIKDSDTNTIYYSSSIVDSVINEKFSQVVPSERWYHPQSIEDAKDIKIITDNIHSYNGHKQVQIMIQFMDVQKKNLAELLRLGFCSVSSIYERCERYVLYEGNYEWLEEDDQLILSYLKGDTNVKQRQAWNACCGYLRPHIVTIERTDGSMSIHRSVKHHRKINK